MLINTFPNLISSNKDNFVYEISQKLEDLFSKPKWKERALIAEKMETTGFEALLYLNCFFFILQKSFWNSVSKHLLCAVIFVLVTVAGAELYMKFPEDQGRWWDRGSGDYQDRYSCDTVLIQSSKGQCQTGDTGKGPALSTIGVPYLCPRYPSQEKFGHTYLHYKLICHWVSWYNEPPCGF